MCPTIIETSNIVSLIVVGNNSKHHKYKICQHAATLKRPIIVSSIINQSFPVTNWKQKEKKKNIWTDQ